MGLFSMAPISLLAEWRDLLNFNPLQGACLGMRHGMGIVMGIGIGIGIRLGTRSTLRISPCFLFLVFARKKLKSRSVDRSAGFVEQTQRFSFALSVEIRWPRKSHGSQTGGQDTDTDTRIFLRQIQSEREGSKRHTPPQIESAQKLMVKINK